MRYSTSGTAAAFVLAAGVCAATASADIVSISVNLDYPSTGEYRLTGQSANILTRTDGLSTGGALDNITSGSSTIGYEELFPAANLTDYLTFGYFGRLETHDGDNVLDTSLIMAFQAGVGQGHRIDDFFSAHNEATLVSALAGFDTPEFFDTLSSVTDSPLTNGVVELPTIGRPGDTLDLIAFVGGPDGDMGVKVGELHFAIIPSPAPITLGAMALAAGLRRRR